MPPYKLCEVADDSLDYVNFLKQQILSELSDLPKVKNFDLGQFVKENSIKLTSPTLLALVSELVSNGDVTQTSLSISQTIQSHIIKSSTPSTLGLAVTLHHWYGSKDFINFLHDYGYVVSYDKVLWFKTSSAKYIGEQDCTARGLKEHSTPIFSWF